VAVLAAGRTSSWLMVVQANLGSELTLFFGSGVLTCRRGGLGWQFRCAYGYLQSELACPARRCGWPDRKGRHAAEPTRLGVRRASRGSLPARRAALTQTTCDAVGLAE
jgi:hypothetical protein